MESHEYQALFICLQTGRPLPKRIYQEHSLSEQPPVLDTGSSTGWVRVTGVISSKSDHVRIPGTGLLLDRVELLRDRPVPRIKDPMVLGVFRNDTKQPMLVGLRPRSGGGTEFTLRPHEVDVCPIEEGEAIAAPALGADDAPHSERKIDKPIAKYKIRFRQLLPANYEYSPEWSDDRTLYYRITNDRIELVPASRAKGWAEAAGRKIL